MLQTTNTILGPEPPSSAYSEGFRVLRANLLALHGREPFTSVLVTSAQPREGKTTVTINLGSVLALAGKRTIIADADAELQGLGKTLHICGSPGLTDVCAGEKTLEDVLQATEIDSLHVMSNGSLHEQASELIVRPSMRQMMQDMAAQADFVLLDATPAVGFGSALTLAPLVDMVLVVARARGDAGTVQQALSTLTDVGAKIGGVVVNDIYPQDSVVADSYYRYYSPDAELG